MQCQVNCSVPWPYNLGCGLLEQVEGYMEVIEIYSSRKDNHK